MAWNVFISGLTDFQVGELRTIRDPERFVFHPLLTYERVVKPETFDFDDLLAAARAELHAFAGSIDAIIAHWDFPTSVLVPILAAERGIPAPSLESVLKCEHKLWSRLEQLESVPECVPSFTSFDPFSESPLAEIELGYPFWVKPVKSHSSQLGFEITDADQFARALEEIRGGIGDVGKAFDQVLARADVPPKLGEATGMSCVAEAVISGTQVAPEGSMYRGEFNVHGFFDMRKDPTGHSFGRLDYPASGVPEAVQARMADVCERFLRHVGFDNGCFNAEFMWDEAREALWLIEVNTRISQSHSDLFAKVDGMSNHEVAIDVALGRRPSMTHREGHFGVAAKFMLSHDEDGIVRRVPTEAEIAELRERFPETHVRIGVAPGDRLDELAHQDAYRYILATLYVGAADRDELEARCRACQEVLRFEIEPIEGSGPAAGDRIAAG